MRKFHDRVSLKQLFEVMKLSSEVEVKADEIVWPDGEKEVTYYIRKKPLSLTKKYVSLFGFNVETIKQLTKEQFAIFLKHKKSFEEQILQQMPIIVTTIGKACTKQFREIKFRKVIIDEATMVKEHEAFLGCINAE